MSTDQHDLTMADGFVTPGRRLNNFTATRAPVGTDDTDSQYEPGSRWHNTVSGDTWACISAAAGVAVWTPTGEDDNYAGEVLVSDTPAGTPLVFADLLQNEDEDDLLHSDAPA